MASETKHSDLENFVKVITRDEISPVLKEFQDSFNKRFDSLEKAIDDRERRIVDDLLVRLKPIVGEFKDKAVIEAGANVTAIIERIWNINPADNGQVEQAQQVWAFSKQMQRDYNKARLTFKQLIFTRAVTLLCILVALGVGSLLGKTGTFFKEYGPIFMGDK